jgi:hypothetical protein
MSRTKVLGIDISITKQSRYQFSAANDPNKITGRGSEDLTSIGMTIWVRLLGMVEHV